ncbi:MAG: XrtA/PEP-CTERM system-associated ATPase [Pseudomonadota bacterium]
MYEEYFGLSGAPFKLNPDPKYFFGSRSHNKAMAYLHYGLKQAEGFIVITGPIGSGKTMVIGHLLDQLNVSNVVAAQLLTSNIAPDELLDHILSAFRIEPEGEGRTGKLEAFEDYLFDQLNRGRRVLLIIDEAQNLPFETLEELRMLSNVDYDGTPLFQVFLIGQPEFRDTLQSDRLEQLRQRVIASYHLESLSADETREYILHRLTVAGWNDNPCFSNSAFNIIFHETKGRPRRINTLCNRLMLYCSLEDEAKVTEAIVKKVVAEFKEESLQTQDNSSTEKSSVDPARKVALPPVRAVSPERKAVGDDEKQARPHAKDDVVVSLDSARARVKVSASADEPHEQVSEASTKTDASDDASDDVALHASEDSDRQTDSKLVSHDAENAVDGAEKPSGKEDSPPITEEDRSSTAVDNEDVSLGDEGGSMEKETAAPELAAIASAIGGSVFDRLKSKRSETANGNGEPRSEATLEDVASAIEEARSNEGGVISADDDALPLMPANAAIPPLAPVQSSEWREKAKTSINSAREELKDAHASMRRVRKSLVEMQKRGREDHQKVVSCISRAESLLTELRKDWT